jgi:hypothetical protein
MKDARCKMTQLFDILLLIMTALMAISTVAAVVVAVMSIKSSNKLYDRQVMHEKNLLKIQRQQIVIDELEKLVQALIDLDISLDGTTIRNQLKFSDKLDIIIQKSNYYTLATSIRKKILAIQDHWQSFQAEVANPLNVEKLDELWHHYVFELEGDVTNVVLALEEYEETLYKD